MEKQQPRGWRRVLVAVGLGGVLAVGVAAVPAQAAPAPAASSHGFALAPGQSTSVDVAIPAGDGGGSGGGAAGSSGGGISPAITTEVCPSYTGGSSGYCTSTGYNCHVGNLTGTFQITYFEHYSQSHASAEIYRITWSNGTPRLIRWGMYGVDDQTGTLWQLWTPNPGASTWDYPAGFYDMNKGLPRSGSGQWWNGPAYGKYFTVNAGVKTDVLDAGGGQKGYVADTGQSSKCQFFLD